MICMMYSMSCSPGGVCMARLLPTCLLVESFLDGSYATYWYLDDLDLDDVDYLENVDDLDDLDN